jgi:cytochrome bd ubiquinol oxidase subunit II
MSAIGLATICFGLIGLGVIAYAVFAGADFGGGVWDLLANGSQADRQREAIAHAIGPVWEANNVWLIYVIVVTWTAFPTVYATVSTALFVPVVLALFGIILRGAAFGFRSQYGRRAGIANAWGHVFNTASTITPFLLGAIAGAIASGGIRLHNGVVMADLWSTWTTPFALVCGAFAVALCSVLAATYLSVEAQSAGDLALVVIFRWRALVAGAVTATIGAVAATLAYLESPVLWRGLVGAALPFSLGAVLIGLGTAAALLLGYYRMARAGVAAETACILAGWGVAQYPYLIIPDVTVSNAAVPPSVLAAVVITSLAGMVVLLPSLWYLFHIFKGRGAPEPGQTAADLADEGVRIAFADPVPGRSVAHRPQDAAPQGSPHTAAPKPAPNDQLLLIGLTAITAVVLFLATGPVYEWWLVRQVRRRSRRERKSTGQRPPATLRS